MVTLPFPPTNPWSFGKSRWRGANTGTESGHRSRCRQTRCMNLLFPTLYPILTRMNLSPESLPVHLPKWSLMSIGRTRPLDRFILQAVSWPKTMRWLPLTLTQRLRLIFTIRSTRSTRPTSTHYKRQIPLLHPSLLPSPISKFPQRASRFITTARSWISTIPSPTSCWAS